MILKLLNLSVVVVAEHHNPTILNADFLARNEIVPDAWGWTLGEDCFSTPPLSQIKYKNGIALLCEQSKLQVVDGREDVDPDTSQVDDIAIKYLRTLPHVHYTGLGVNFKAMIPCEQPRRVLMERFLKEGIWSEPSQDLEDMGLRLDYKIDHGRMRISLDAGEVRSATEKDGLTSIVTGANFHHDLVGDARVDQIENFVKRKIAYWGRFQSMLSQMMDHVEFQTK